MEDQKTYKGYKYSTLEEAKQARAAWRKTYNAQYHQKRKAEIKLMKEMLEQLTQNKQ